MWDYCSNGNLFTDSCLNISRLLQPLLRGLGFFIVDSAPVGLQLLSQFSMAWATCDGFKYKRHFAKTFFSNSHYPDHYSCVFFSPNLWLAITWYNLLNENRHVLGITGAAARTVSFMMAAFGLWENVMRSPCSARARHSPALCLSASGNQFFCLTWLRLLSGSSRLRTLKWELQARPSLRFLHGGPGWRRHQAQVPIIFIVTSMSMLWWWTLLLWGSVARVFLDLPRSYLTTRLPGGIIKSFQTTARSHVLKVIIQWFVDRNVRDCGCVITVSGSDA